jgi:hypothetical protein
MLRLPWIASNWMIFSAAMPSLTGELSPPPALEGSTPHIGGTRARLKRKATRRRRSPVSIGPVAVAIFLLAAGCSDPPDPSQKPARDVALDTAADVDADVAPGRDQGADAPARDTRDGASDVREITPDTPEPDLGADTGEPVCDDLENNGSPGRATRVDGSGAALASRVCPDDVDWFRIDAEAGDRLVIDLRFRHDDGDLDVALYGPDLVEWDRADSADDNELLDADVPESGPWWVQVYGFDGATADYTLSYERQPGAGACVDDELEDDDTPRAAATILPPQVLNARLCPADDDHKVIWLAQGARLNVTAEFAHQEGDLDLELLSPTGEVLSSSRSETDNEALGIEIRAGGWYTLRVLGFALNRDGVDYALRMTARDNPAPDHVAAGIASFHDPFWSDADARLGYLPRPLVGTLVEIVGQEGVVGAGYTDGRGRFAVGYDDTPGPLYARVVAARVGPGADLAVVDEARRLYAVRQPGEFLAGGSAEIGIHLDDGPSLSAPFNALDAGAQGLEWWRGAAGYNAAPVPLHFLWQEGQNLECGTCYRDGDRPKTIYLYGVPNDNDALDDPVILHELGHYLQNVYSSQDSPGGSHDGAPVDPRLAWAEGWATAFSGMVRGDPVYFDTRGDRRTTHDIETPDTDYGTFTGDVLSDPISEYLVAALMYDFWDEQDDGDDALWAGPDVIRPLTEHLRDGQVADRGIAGVDLVDYLDGALCLDVLDRPALDARLAQAGVPYRPRDAVCRKPQIPLTVGARSVRSHRPLDTLEIFICVAAECRLATTATKLQEGDEVPLPATSDRLELVARRGAAVWAWVGPQRAPTPPAWIPAKATSAGADVVERSAPTR